VVFLLMPSSVDVWGAFARIDQPLL
jgi:hypothetical protein